MSSPPKPSSPPPAYAASQVVAADSSKSQDEQHAPAQSSYYDIRAPPFVPYMPTSSSLMPQGYRPSAYSATLGAHSPTPHQHMFGPTPLPTRPRQMAPGLAGQGELLPYYDPRSPYSLAQAESRTRTRFAVAVGLGLAVWFMIGWWLGVYIKSA